VVDDAPRPVSGGIDVHGHGVPLPFLSAVGRARCYGVDVLTDPAGSCVLTFPGRPPLRPMSRLMLDFDERLNWLDGQRMERQLVAPWLDVHGQELDPPQGQDWVRRLNDAMAEATAGANGRLAAHATLHLADPAAAANELARCHTELGMQACMIPTHPPGVPLDHPRYDALWETAGRLDVPVTLHPPTAGPGSTVQGMEQFGGLYGRLIDTTAAATRLVLAGVFDRFPALSLVLVHGGGFLPYQAGRLAQEQAGGHLGRDLANPVLEYVQRFFFDTVLMSGPALRLLLELAGKERVLIGSDYPFAVDAPKLTAALSEATSDDEVRAAVTSDNARRLYGDGRPRP
jgi:aminocarboxymuconate-semialdehyde decarboxylase